MRSKHYSIIVAPSDGRKTYHLRVSFVTLATLGSILVLIGSAVVFLLATYGSLTWRVRNWEDLNQRCAQLEEEQVKLVALEEEVEALRDMDRRIRKLVGLSEPHGAAVAFRQEGSDGPSGRDEGLDEIVLPDAVIPTEEEWVTMERDLKQYQHSLVWPVAGFVSSTFGEERSSGGIHTGIDIAAPLNSVVETPLPGEVGEAGWHPVYGNVAVVDHGDGLITVYGHNSRLVVREGEQLKRGDVVAFLGNTGKSSAPHLHFEVRKNGFAVDPVYLLVQRPSS